MRAERIADLIAETAHLKSPEAFTGEHPYPFLVREATKMAAVPVPGADRRTLRLGKAVAPAGDGFAQGDVWIFRVCPEDPERNEGAVLLGRDPSCDIEVEDGSVSIEHARFTLEWGDGDEKLFFVTDAGSSNGTWLNGDRLESESPTRLSDQDSIRVGPAVKLQFFTAEGFYDFLDLYRRIKKP